MIRTMQRAAVIAIAVLAAILRASPVGAESVSDFYKGHDLTILVPSGAAGLNALYARTVGDQWAKHIPGNPKVVYRYMPGGGGRKGTNHCYNAAPKDGSMVCVPFNSFTLTQLLQPRGIRYNARKFHYLGNASDMNGSFAVWHRVPVTSLMDARKTEVILIGTDTGSPSYHDPAIVNSLFGTKFKVVTGFRGGGALELSVESGEMLGHSGPLLSWTMRKPHWLKSGRIRFLAQVGLRRMPDFPDVPLLTEFAGDDEKLRILKFISSRAGVGRPFVAPPGTPRDRVAALREAFVAAMNDPALIADMKARRLHHQWSRGGDVENIIAQVLATPKSLVAKVRAILGYK